MGEHLFVICTKGKFDDFDRSALRRGQGGNGIGGKGSKPTEQGSLASSGGRRFAYEDQVERPWTVDGRMAKYKWNVAHEFYQCKKNS